MAGGRRTPASRCASALRSALAARPRWHRSACWRCSQRRESRFTASPAPVRAPWSGAALAAGRLGEFRAAMEGLSRRRVLRLLDVAWPRAGLLHGLRALEFVRPYFGETIEDLGIPYAAVATDLRSGDEVSLSRGGVFDAVRASIAIPGIFTPWRVGGCLLVDGGLVNPVPVSTARALGAEFVIALTVLPLRNGQRAAHGGADRGGPPERRAGAAGSARRARARGASAPPAGALAAARRLPSLPDLKNSPCRSVAA